jgi:hypothetical protein
MEMDPVTEVPVRVSALNPLVSAAIESAAKRI